MKKINAVAVAALITFSAVSASYAIAGIGVHWGFDLSLSMENAVNERVNIPGVSDFFSQAGISEDYSLITISRDGWKRSVINFGGKAYIDFIPFLPIDAIELSCNFGVWQYNGSLQYLNVTETVAGGAPVYSEPINLGVKTQDLGYFGLEGTPYAKLHLDFTVKKELFSLILVKFDAGLGMSVHFSTPLLSASLVEKALEKAHGTDINAILAGLNENATGGELGKQIVEEILNQTLNNAVYGAHIFLGARAKLPVIPVGIYVDGKFMLPLSNFDKDAGGDKSPINGFGLLVNAGISLSF